MIKKILWFIPTTIYMSTISLFIMPIIYGKRKWGVVGFIPLWILNIILSITLLIVYRPWVSPVHDFLNKLSNKCMGYGWRTVSNELGIRIDNNIHTKIECIHCSLLGIYDPAGWHCSPKAKGY